MKIKQTYEDFCQAQVLINKVRVMHAAVESQADGALPKPVDSAVRRTLAKQLGGEYMTLATEGLAPMPVNNALTKKATAQGLVKLHNLAQEGMTDTIAKLFGFKKAISTRGASQLAKAIVQKLKEPGAEIDSQVLIGLIPETARYTPRDAAGLTKAIVAEVENVSKVQTTLSEAAAKAWGIYEGMAKKDEAIADDIALEMLQEIFSTLKQGLGVGITDNEGLTRYALLGGYELEVKAPAARFPEEITPGALDWIIHVKQTHRAVKSDYPGENLNSRQEVELGLVITQLGRVEQRTLSRMDQVSFKQSQKSRVSGFDLDEGFNIKDSLSNHYVRAILSAFAAWGVVSYVVIGEGLKHIDQAIFVKEQKPEPEVVSDSYQPDSDTP